KRRDVPANLLAVLLLLVTIVPLILQPDFGQTMLVSLVWAALFVIAGLHWFWVAGVGGAGLGGALLAYKLVPHVRARVLKFVDAGAGGGMADTFQVDTALDSFLSGGWFGKGPGEGTIKRILPDAHTDFIFAVTGEEFGVLACLLIAVIFAFIVLRGLFVAARNEDPFCRFAAAGLVILFGLQSAINMAVNVHLIPAKGMTLPFISYGGSSLISLGLAIGLLIAVMRKRPGAAILADARAEAVP
ncbi:MAG: FtsW/RodA/SpoVE family cell cycle protein, partial [Methylocella sp.]